MRVRHRCGFERAELVAAANRAGRADLLHQVVVPVAFDLEMRGSAKLDGLDQVMSDVGVDARLAERVERSTGRAAADEPGLKILFRPVGELARLPDIVAVATDQMRAAVAIGLAVDDENLSRRP